MNLKDWRQPQRGGLTWRQRVARAWRRAGVLGACGGLALSCLMASPARAVDLSPTATSLSSTADRMISYRFQERMWQTADGRYHLVINRGALSPTGSLVLYSSGDGGLTWSQQAVIADTNGTSTCDGYLNGNLLALSFSTSSGAINFGTWRYDPATQAWSRRRVDTVYEDPTQLAFNPAVAADATGAQWLAYVIQDRNTKDAAIRLAHRPAGALAWADTGLVFGEVDNLSIQRSARPWPIPGGMGLLYTVREKIFWATRSDGALPSTPWADTTLFVAEPPFDPDPYGGHFSLMSDQANNLHMVTPDKGKALYFRFDFATQQWQPPRTVNGANGVGYVQMARVDNTLVMVANSVNRGEVFQSTDLGFNWTRPYSLTHPAPSGTIAYSPPRLEMAGTSSGPAPVLQLFTDGKLFRLMQFSVPVPPP
jgi:hypothetical protein